MKSYAIRRGDAVRYMSVPAGAFAARHADSHGHRPQKHLDLRKHARTPALRQVQRRIIETGFAVSRAERVHGGQLAGAAARGRDQCDCLVAVNLRPDAVCRTRNEPLQPRLVAVTPLLPVDPSITQGYLERLAVGYRLKARSFLRQPQPQTLRVAMFFFKPRGPIGLNCKQADRVVRVADFRFLRFQSVCSARRRRSSSVRSTARHPLIAKGRTQLLVELDGPLTPLEHLPVYSGAVLLDGITRDVGQRRLPMPRLRNASSTNKSFRNNPRPAHVE